MELQIKPHSSNLYPLKGILIKSASVAIWLKEIQNLHLVFAEITIYAIPNKQANSIWGCLLVMKNGKKINNMGTNTYCQCIHHKLFIPENATLHPKISEEEINQLFKQNLHIFHPDFGLVELEEEINWQAILNIPQQLSMAVTKPANSVFIPQEINSFQIKETPPEEILKELEENIFPKKENFEKKPLNLLEKAKLAILRQVFKKNKSSNTTDNTSSTKKPSWLEKLGALFSPKKGNNWADKLQLDYEELEKRNQQEIEKLLELFKKNPEEALKYAIPLDNDGTTRGGDKELFKMSKRWFDFSLFKNTNVNSKSSGNSVMPDEYFNQLYAQYNKTAQDLIQEKEFQKAAFVYMRLLKNYHLAAQTLENGKLYPQAAAVYLKYGKNKAKAAECYEKAHMTLPAIEIYTELNQHEKVGDLYLTLNKRDIAHSYFEKVIEDYKTTMQYVKASLIYKNKIENTQKAQNLLIDGWIQDKDAFNCLNNYFSNIEDMQVLENEIQRVYNQTTNEANKDKFLQALKYEHDKTPKIGDITKEIAYEIVAEKLKNQPQIVSELQFFNKKDKNLVKDIIKYKHGKKK